MIKDWNFRTNLQGQLILQKLKQVPGLTTAPPHWADAEVCDLVDYFADIRNLEIAAKLADQAA